MASCSRRNATLRLHMQTSHIFEGQLCLVHKRRYVAQRAADGPSVKMTPLCVRGAYGRLPVRQIDATFLEFEQSSVDLTDGQSAVRLEYQKWRQNDGRATRSEAAMDNRVDWGTRLTKHGGNRTSICGCPRLAAMTRTYFSSVPVKCFHAALETAAVPPSTWPCSIVPSFAAVS